MAATDDGQAAGVINGKVDAAALGAGGVTAVPVRPDSIVSQPTFVSGTAKQLSATNITELYIDITTAASLKIEMGATSTPATVLSAAKSSALGTMSFRVPAGWYVKITGTIGNLVINAIQIS